MTCPHSRDFLLAGRFDFIAGYLARGSISEGERRGSVLLAALLVLTRRLLSAGRGPRGMGEWKRANLRRGPRGSSVAPGGARSLQGSSGGARSPRGSSIAPLCVGSWPGGVGLRAVAGCRCGRSRPSTPLPGGLSCLFILISSLAFCSFTAPVSLFTRFCAQQTLLSLRNEAHKEEEEDATWTEKDL